MARRRRKKGGIGRYVILAILLGCLGWTAVTCSTRQTVRVEGAATQSPSSEDAVAAGPTPLPAQPMGVRTRLPGPGEPPTGDFSEDEEAFIDSLPVGNADDTPAPPPLPPPTATPSP